MNLEYFKRKFDTLYKQNDTKREDIAAKTGIDKNKITKLRRMKYDTQPTIDDLIAISDYYHVTVDELLRPQEETEQNKEQEKSFDSLGDIAKSLFEIGKCIKLHLASINVEVGQTEYGEPITDYHTCIYFSNQRMCELLNEWKKISFATFDVGCGEKLKSLWEKDAIENYKQYTKENDFIAININQKDNVYTEIFIIDSGVGIKQEDIPYIFDRFFRSENVRDKDIEGSGIGLSIAKMIAINLGAEISVKCENNKTEFKIIIQNNKCDKIT